MKQVIVNVGVSGAGKTTWSINKINNSEKFMRVNRDDIRTMLVGTLKGYWRRANTNEIENYINELEQMILLNHMSSGYNVIIDNTNLTPRYIQKWISFVKNYNDTLPSTEQYEKFEVKFKIFSENDRNILRERIQKRDNLLDEQLIYIDRQIISLQNAVMYVKDNYKDQIIND